MVANIANISPGMSLGFSAVALPQLQDENATFHIDESQASWIGKFNRFNLRGIFSSLLQAYGESKVFVSFWENGIVESITRFHLHFQVDACLP